MRKYFIIIANKPNQEDITSISNLFRDRYGWWHWVADGWLVVDSTGALTAKSIRDSIEEINPSLRNIVLQVDPVTWAGMGPNVEGSDMFEWVKKNWKKID